MTAQGVIIRAQSLSPFPPSFEDNPLTYGSALGSLILTCALALATLWRFFTDWRMRRVAADKAMNIVAEPVPFSTPLAVHRWIITGFLLTILSGALPDVLVLLCWGEANASTLEHLFLVDRIGDSLVAVWFTATMLLSAWATQVIPQQLAREARIMMRRPTVGMFRDTIKIIAAAVAIAIAVTLTKAGM